MRNFSKLTVGPIRLCSALLLALVIALTSAVGRAQPYRFDLIAQTGSGFGQLGVPTLNAGGEVAFFAVESAPNLPDRQSIYTGTAGHNPTLIARQGDRPILAGCGKNQSWGTICRIMKRNSLYSCRDPIPGQIYFVDFAGFSRLWADSGHGYASACTSFVSRTRL